MTVTVCVDFNGSCRDRGLFIPGFTSYQRLRELGEEQGCRISMVNMERNGSEGYSAELSHMERELSRSRPRRIRAAEAAFRCLPRPDSALKRRLYATR